VLYRMSRFEASPREHDYLAKVNAHMKEWTQQRWVLTSTNLLRTGKPPSMDTEHYFFWEKAD
jgi:hypothetical protein